MFANVGPQILGAWIWQWVVLIAMLLGAVIINRLLRNLAISGARKILSMFSIEPEDPKSINRLTRVLVLLLVTRIVLFAVPFIHFPQNIHSVVAYTLGGFCTFFVIICAYRTVDVISRSLVERIPSKRLRRGNGPALLALAQTGLKILVVIVGAIVILERMGVNFTALVAGISIGGAAIALASQDTIRNLFGSFMIFVDHPFGVGDWIVSERVDGIVEEIGFRSTRVRTFANSVISVPNGKLADMTIDNLGMRAVRRIQLVFQVATTTPPDNLDGFLSDVQKIISEHPDTLKEQDKLQSLVSGVKDSAFTVTVVTFIPSSKGAEEGVIKDAIIRAVYRSAVAHQIQFITGGGK